MAEESTPNYLLNPIGTPYDHPADPVAIGAGEGATLFALLKAILLKLAQLVDEPA